jgi:hypothetical protein
MQHLFGDNTSVSISGGINCADIDVVSGGIRYFRGEFIRNFRYIPLMPLQPLPRFVLDHQHPAPAGPLRRGLLSPRVPRAPSGDPFPFEVFDLSSRLLLGAPLTHLNGSKVVGFLRELRQHHLLDFWLEVSDIVLRVCEDSSYLAQVRSVPTPVADNIKRMIARGDQDVLPFCPWVDRHQIFLSGRTAKKRFASLFRIGTSDVQRAVQGEYPLEFDGFSLFVVERSSHRPQAKVKGKRKTRKRHRR